ncbi:phage tail protein [Hafnia paralvei]|uniref:phage tail protein n=1 Tax=Hafnia paralvei TaxID=546367 RepID=UPI0029DC54E6|nr:phage tail protein [Hafnia paralvei]MDX6912261.1 phage tail protein [Hafnia paralvei]
MAAKFFALLTNLGAAKLANATALGTKLEITQMAVGDGGGALPIPDPAQQALKGEKRRAAINLITIDPLNTNQIITEQVIPENEGGWWIREIGLFDKDGTLIAIANCPETYKPLLQEGSGRTQTIRVILIVSSTESVSLKIDPSVVLATRKYVDDAVIEVRQYADGLMMAHEADKNPHSQYLQIANALKEIKDANLVAKVLENLGLGVGTPAIGIPFFWPSSAMPNTVMTEWSDMVFLKFNGSTFSASAYPKLALVIPSLTLVDARGEFPRIWDDGRGIDVGRQLLSYQGDAIRNITGWFGTHATVVAAAPFVKFSAPVISENIGVGGGSTRDAIKIDLSLSVPTSIENRPRNIAFNFLVRAK